MRRGISVVAVCLLSLSPLDKRVEQMLQLAERRYFPTIVLEME